jgi:hypothetical protein
VNDLTATIAGLREQLATARTAATAAQVVSKERLKALLDAERTITVLTDRCSELQAEVERLRLSVGLSATR